MPNIRNKNGELSEYGFLCGYIERENRFNIMLDLYLDGNTYHVKAYDYENHKRLFWEVFEKIIRCKRIL
jgi:hypothetical protein